MTVDPLTRRELDKMERERKARARAEAEERKLARSLAALTPEERAELARRVNEQRFESRVAGPVYLAALLTVVVGALWTGIELVRAGEVPLTLAELPIVPLTLLVAGLAFVQWGPSLMQKLIR